jgi:hypothetical protein
MVLLRLVALLVAMAALPVVALAAFEGLVVPNPKPHLAAVGTKTVARVEVHPVRKTGEVVRFEVDDRLSGLWPGSVVNLRDGDLAVAPWRRYELALGRDATGRTVLTADPLTLDRRMAGPTAYTVLPWYDQVGIMVTPVLLVLVAGVLVLSLRQSRTEEAGIVMGGLRPALTRRGRAARRAARRNGTAPRRAPPRAARARSRSSA